MKYIIVLCCIVVATVAAEKYTSKFDNLNVDEILGNKRLLTAYVDCVLGKAKCTPEGNELKSHVQEALETGCAKCTDTQEKESPRVLKYLIEEEPAMWKALTDKFDPTGKFRKQYEDRAKAQGITY